MTNPPSFEELVIWTVNNNLDHLSMKEAHQAWSTAIDEQIVSAWKESGNTENLDRIKNVKSQLLTTASNPLCESILVDGGSGTMTELLKDAAECLELTVEMPMWLRKRPQWSRRTRCKKLDMR